MIPDSAIDQVAARLVAVPDHHDQLAQRIVSALPDRSSRLRWLIPQFAAIAAVALAIFVWTRTARPPVPAVLPSSAVTAMGALASVVNATAPGTPSFRSRPLEHARVAELSESSRSDFERALPALASVASLVMREVGVADLDPMPLSEPASISIPDLKLSAEDSWRREE
jgi:hypothetical protein